MKRSQPRQHVRVCVADEKRRLEEYHGDGPHCRRAAEPRQYHLREHRLYAEQQQRRDEQRCGIEDGRQPYERRLCDVLKR